MAHIVDHLNQVVHVNNILLVDLQEAVVERQQVGALHIAFQFDGLFGLSHHHLPAAHIVVVLEQAHVILVDHLEVDRIGIEP